MSKTSELKKELIHLSRVKEETEFFKFPHLNEEAKRPNSKITVVENWGGGERVTYELSLEDLVDKFKEFHDR